MPVAHIFQYVARDTMNSTTLGKRGTANQKELRPVKRNRSDDPSLLLASPKYHSFDQPEGNGNKIRSKLIECSGCPSITALAHPRSFLDKVEMAAVLSKTGNMCFEDHDMHGALKYYQQGLKIELAIYDSCHPCIFATLANIAHTHLQLENYSQALLYYRDSYVRSIKVYGQKSLEAAKTLSSMALTQLHMNENWQAVCMYLEVLEVQREVYGSDENQDVASTLHSIGMILVDQGVFKTGRQYFVDSLAIRRCVLGPNHLDIAFLCYNIAAVSLAMGDEDDYVKYLKESLKVQPVEVSDCDINVIWALTHLGHVLLQRGELDEAFEHFCKALDLERRSGNLDELAQAKIINIIGNIQLQRAQVSDMMTWYAEATRIYIAMGLDTDALVIAGYNYYSHSKLYPQCASMA